MVLHKSKYNRTRGALPDRYLRLTHWNIGGLISDAHGNKIEDPDFLRLVKDEDILALTETHIGEDVELSIPGYIIKRKVRKKSKKAKVHSGGIVLAIKSNLEKNVQLIGSKSDNILWAKIKCADGGKDFLLGVVYISPLYSSYSKNILVNQFRTWEILMEELALFKSKYRIGLMGDFNARSGGLSDIIINDDNRYVELPNDYIPDVHIMTRSNSDTVINSFGERLVELCRMSGMRIVNGRKIGDSFGKKTCHEWNGSSTVDYMLGDENLFRLIQMFRVRDEFNHLSDHCPISATLNFNCFKNTLVVKQPVRSAPKNIKWDAKIESLFKMKMACKNTDKKINEMKSVILDSEENIESVLLNVNTILKDAVGLKDSSLKLRKYCKKSSKKADRPWFSKDLKVLKKNVRKAGNEFVRNCSDNTLRQRFFKLKKHFKIEVKHRKREFKQGLYDRLETLSEDNPKEYWELFNKMKNCHKFNGHDHNDCPINDAEWIDHYFRLLGPQKYNSEREKAVWDETSRLVQQPYFSELDYTISTREIRDAGKYLKSNKAAGLDGIRNEMIKYSLPYMVDLYRIIFNSILCKQYYPSCWKTGVIVNLFKSGDMYSTDNYRGLTINSCLAKLFNTVLNNRLMKFLESKNIICDNQIGFKTKARTSDHIFIINTLFRKFCKSNQRLYLCFVDFKKAYDSVWRDALMLKLLRLGVRGNFFGTVKNMYDNCKACIKSDGLLSDTFECKSGVKQGDVMSPNLFNVFINDLPEIFIDDTDSPKLNEIFVHCLMYADDVVLISLTEDGLQHKLNKLYKYCCDWALNINVKKTQVMAMSSTKMETPNRDMYIGNSKIQWVHTYKYLGILISSNGNFVSTSENLCMRGWKAFFKIKSALKDVDAFPKLKLKLFDVLIRPVICYNSEIWGIMNNVFNSKSISQFWDRVTKLNVETFHLKFCKGLLGVHPNAINVAVMGELGRLPIFLSIIKSALKYLIHVNEVKDERPLLKAAVDEDKVLCLSKSWYRRLDKIVSFFKFNINKTITNKCISRLHFDLKESYINYWKKSLGDVENEEGRLYLYRKIKTDFKMEPYLEQISKFKYRRSVTAFRISAHKLEIETGRYIRILNAQGNNTYLRRNDRFCTLCYEERGIRVTGDEQHAILQCPHFFDIRKKLTDQIESFCKNFKNLDDRDKLLYILTCENECIIKVGRFLNLIISSQRPNFSKIWKAFSEHVN